MYNEEYPRPQFVRGQWQNLNGEWDFSFDDEKKGLEQHWEQSFPRQKKILVPFTYETERSGIGDSTHHAVVWYNRSFHAEDPGKGKNILLHFEGCDYVTSVFINGLYAGCHRGGYNRFTFDITDAVRKGENRITVRVEDTESVEIPRGKQRWEKDNFGCWYVQTTGIWKTVWTETVPAERIDSVKITPQPADYAVDMSVALAGCIPSAEAGRVQPTYKIKIDVTFAGERICSSTQQTAASGTTGFRLPLWNTAVSEWGLKLWTPETPDLYDVELQLIADDTVTDTVTSYFGLRDIRTENQRVLLNGHPYYQRLILDQAYWKASSLTAPDMNAFIEDIDKIKEAGYNGVRLHQKIEDERFYYLCDVKGLLVWCEAPSAYKFSDSLLTDFTQQWTETVRQLYNHPCIVTWTVLNESWGVPRIKTNRNEQHFSEMLYHLTKAIDPMRPVIVNDGWEHTVSDIITLHDYEEKGSVLYERYMKNMQGILDGTYFHNTFKTAFAEGFSYRGQPVMISEYGGIAFTGNGSGWGYGQKVADEESYLVRFEDITTAIKRLPFVCGYCYTQVTDVQQEINGIMDIDRKFKVPAEKLREINLRTV
jgi:beta-galactosidase/beta-glucuronidase